MAGTNYVLSMNPSFFSGRLGYESTLRHFLLDGNGVSSGQTYQKYDYQHLFEEVGLKRDDYIRVVEAAIAVLKSEGVKGGVLLQIDDGTDERTLMNRVSYVSGPFGFQYRVGVSTSDLIDGHFPFSPNMQIRLIFDNMHTLNPYSGLRIKRYTFGGSKDVDEKVMKAIKDALQTLPVDAAKRDAYKKRLEKLFNLN